ncbi:MAG: L,D-transpeptidase family protein [Bacteroidota bacterium]
MKRDCLFYLLLGIVFTSFAQSPPSKQVILVVTDSWDSQTGHLFRFQRLSEASPWRQVGPSWPVVVGKSGLAWGNGLEDFRKLDGPKKEEGDGTSPAGCFSLGPAFGRSPSPEISFRYTPIDSTTQCIEDTGSAYYNRLVNEQTPYRDWNSTDLMLRTDSLYHWGIFVHHNPDQEAQAGSCIFFHGWRAASRPTAGCTALSLKNLEHLIRWLKPRAGPFLVQVPKSQLALFIEDYDLPQIP